MTIVGGLRSRLIKESFYQMLLASLDDLEWLESGRWHNDVTVRSVGVDDDEEIVPNVVAIVDDDVNSVEAEMGSRLTEFRAPYYIDVYAQSAAVGMHLATDVRDILEGRFPSIGRDAPNFMVMDYSLATPTDLFVCDLENVELNRAQTWNKEHERYWYSIYCEIVDTYGDENDDI